MAQLSVKINGYAYTVACEDGQETHLQDMARQVEARIDSIKSLSGSSGEGLLLVLAGLLMADELHDGAIELQELRAQLSAGAPEAVALAPRSPVAAENATSRRVAKLARKAEDIAASLEQP